MQQEVDAEDKQTTKFESPMMLEESPEIGEGDTEISSENITCSDNHEDDENDTGLCPLFMDKLPRDFATNPHLAAIASLLDEEDDEEESENNTNSNEGGHLLSSSIQCSTPIPGGGKVGVSSAKRGKHSGPNSSRTSRSYQPYPAQKDAKKKPKKASVGEAQLFLNMWKL